MPRRLSLFVAAIALSSTAALAVSEKLKDACGADYASYCSAYKVTSPPSANLRACMRSHRHQLLERCLRALKNAGYSG